MTTTDQELEVVELNSNNYMNYAHYADSVSVTEGYVTGKIVKAICGKFFVPSKDPKDFPVCPICKQLAETLFLDVEN